MPTAADVAVIRKAGPKALQGGFKWCRSAPWSATSQSIDIVDSGSSSAKRVLPARASTASSPYGWVCALTMCVGSVYKRASAFSTALQGLAARLAVVCVKASLGRHNFLSVLQNAAPETRRETKGRSLYAHKCSPQRAVGLANATPRQLLRACCCPRTHVFERQAGASAPRVSEH